MGALFCYVSIRTSIALNWIIFYISKNFTLNSYSNSKIPKNNEKEKKELTVFLGFEIMKHKVTNP